MKKWLGYILPVYILFCTVVPCCSFDSCEEEPATAEHSDSRKEGDCNSCTPFSFCAATPIYTIQHQQLKASPVLAAPAPEYGGYIAYFASGYYSRPFQPPRHA